MNPDGPVVVIGAAGIDYKGRAAEPLRPGTSVTGVVRSTLGGVARNMRVMRGNLLDVLGAQYVQTARSKGLKENTVVVRHASGRWAKADDVTEAGRIAQ